DRVIATAGAAVYGRTTYGMMRGYWPGVLNDEKAPDDRRAHARWVEAAEKITFSRSLETSDWNNVHLKWDAEDIAALKRQAGKPLLIFGSPGLVRSFQALDAIDEYWMFLNPVLLGEGVRFFDGAHGTRFRIADAKRIEPDVMRFHYVRRDAQ
ncbi:MAG: dihydrofolate reductase family protein, partial [Alphaproteobacteria bacterium]|nr:dihydrofolate reductase family protein [Alphaproteobacteria bacterium]